MKYPITAQRLREALDKANMTQQELSDKSGIGKSSISHYINGSNEPGNKSAYAIAQVLGVNPAWLMGLDVPMTLRISPEHLVEYAYPGVDAKTKEHLIAYAKLFIELMESPEEFRDAWLTLLKSQLKKP